MSLTKTQLKALKECAVYNGAYIWMPGTTKKLAEMGLVKANGERHGRDQYVITEAGREMLRKESA